MEYNSMITSFFTLSLPTSKPIVYALYSSRQKLLTNFASLREFPIRLKGLRQILSMLLKLFKFMCFVHSKSLAMLNYKRIVKRLPDSYLLKPR